MVKFVFFYNDFLAKKQEVLSYQVDTVDLTQFTGDNEKKFINLVKNGFID